MNAIVKALQDIKYNIPLEVLQIGFVENYERVNHIRSLDDRITNSVLRPRVLTDCNLIGGVTMSIPTDRCVITQPTPREFIIEVPKQVTSNRSIISVLSLVSYAMGTWNNPYVGASSTLTQGAHMFNSLATESIIQTARLELIGENTILVEEPNVGLTTATLRAVIGYDENLNNLNPRSYLDFSRLCMYAVKSYIYNNCTVKLDQGYVWAGHELGKIGEIIDSYSDAEEMYIEHLTQTMRKVLFYNDKNNTSRLIASMLGNTL